MTKVKKNYSIENNIDRNYFKNNIYSKDKIRLNKIIQNIYTNIDTKKDTLHLFSKKFILDFRDSGLKKFIRYQTVILIGMGGSILGAHAIYSALKQKIRNNFIFIDNLDQHKIENIKKKINLKNSLFIIISKSGNTIETLINCNLLENTITSKNTIIITEQKKNLLNTFAVNKKILLIKHKEYIGGRYSVLSEVGIVPAYFMGLKVGNLRKKILLFFKSKQNSILIESVIKLAHIYSSNKIKSIVLLNYSPELSDFLYWCQQLIAESLGKNKKGILPIVSAAPRDHHSLLQLYLDGPNDKLFYIFSLNLNKQMKINNNIFGKSFKFVKNKQLATVIESQRNALIKVLKKKKIPFREFKINKINEEVLGELFSYFMLETALIGKLSGINPFDQPAVEEVKILTRENLS